MATTGKAPGGPGLGTPDASDDLKPSAATRDPEGAVGNTEGISGGGIPGAPQGTSGASGLSSIPGGRSRSGMAGGPSSGATEGWTGQIREGASTLVNRAQDVAGDVAQRAQDIASQATDTLGTTIRRYPLQSLMVGFGIGCLVGLLIPSRR